MASSLSEETQAARALDRDGFDRLLDAFRGHELARERGDVAAGA
jgi:hypothetical protein